MRKKNSVSVCNREVGNTNQLRGSYGKRFCFTLNNYTDSDVTNLMCIINKDNMFYVVGKEVGDEGTPHLQGYIECSKRIRPIEYFGNKKIHWEIAKGSRDQNFYYCSKECQYTTNIIDVYVPDITHDKLYTWQKEIVDICLSMPDKRTIHWYWDLSGNTGKTTLAKFLSFYHGAIPLRGKTNDILYCAAEHRSNVYIFIAPRSNEDYFPYEGLELIKDGFYMCPKYESKPIIRSWPHVFVFANFEPNMLKLSCDRWSIRQIDQ